MIDIISVIGTLASIGAFPYAYYLYLKSREEKVDKVRREIVESLLQQIGLGQKLSHFEIQSVINSKLRENKLNTNLIGINEVIEDVVARTISNPLVEQKEKQTILTSLRETYFGVELYELVDEVKQDPSKLLKQPEEIADKLVNRLREQQIESEDENQGEKKSSSKVERISSTFAVISTVTTILATAGIEWFLKMSLDNLLGNSRTEFFSVVVLGLVVTLVGIVVGSLISWRLRKKKTSN